MRDEITTDQSQDSTPKVFNAAKWVEAMEAAGCGLYLMPEGFGINYNRSGAHNMGLENIRKRNELLKEYNGDNDTIGDANRDSVLAFLKQHFETYSRYKKSEHASDISAPVQGLENLKTGIRYGERWYDAAGDKAAYPRYHSDERARFYPHYLPIEGADIVIHTKDGKFLVRRLLKDNDQTIIARGFNLPAGGGEIEPETYAKSDLVGVYPVRARVTTETHYGYTDQSPAKAAVA